MRCRNDPTKWPLKEIPQHLLSNNNLNIYHPLFSHPMERPPIIPSNFPNLMVRNLPAPLPPRNTYGISNSQVSTNLNPDVPEFIPRNILVKLKTEENYDIKDCEQTKKDLNKNATSSDKQPIEKSNKITSQHFEFGNNTVIYN